MPDDFGALITCKNCTFKCNITPYDTIAEVKFWAKHQAKTCGDTIKTFEPYVKESKRIVRVLEAVL